MRLFHAVPMPEQSLGTAVNRLTRCAVTYRVIVQQLDILETMVHALSCLILQC
jgi:hypothetical protein